MSEINNDFSKYIQTNNEPTAALPAMTKENSLIMGTGPAKIATPIEPIKLPYDVDINIVKQYDIYRYWQQKYDPYVKGIPVGFMTTPVMNLTAQNYNLDSFFLYMSKNYPDIYNSLTAMDPTASGTITPSTSPFIRMLTNSFKGLDGKDLTSKTIDIGETYYGHKQSLPGPNIDSITGDTINIKYSDSKNLHIILLHKLWMEYIENVSRGKFAPYKEIANRSEIDYVSTLYYFILDEDMETILFYSRYIGMAPISNPYSALTTTLGGDRSIPEIDIDYIYSFKQDLNPEILVDFNKIVQNEYSKLRGTTNNAATSVIYDYDTYVGDKPLDLTKSLFTNPPVICKQPTGDSSGGINPKTLYKLVYK